MTREAKGHDFESKGGNFLARRMVIRTRIVSAFIWALLGAIFLLDVLTTPDNVSVCFAYAIPIFMSLFELRPRPVLYAAVSTGLSLVGSFVQPPSEASIVVFAANRLIAIGTQWLTATLVGLQQSRLVEAQEKAEHQQRFVDILSHEVGNALTAVTGQAYRIGRLSSGPISPEDLKSRAEKIRKAAERIEVIIARVQFASSLGDGTIPIRHDIIHLQEIIRQLLEQMGDDQRERIELNSSPNALVVSGDDLLLRQMFENIIMNSIKYSSADSPIAIDVTERGSFTRITVTDHGTGIPPRDLSRIRIPYYRGGNSKGTSGVGLGLYLVERIVEAHKGRLFIESEIGDGTKVTVELPLDKASQQHDRSTTNSLH